MSGLQEKCKSLEELRRAFDKVYVSGYAMDNKGRAALAQASQAQAGGPAGTQRAEHQSEESIGAGPAEKIDARARAGVDQTEVRVNGSVAIWVFSRSGSGDGRGFVRAAVDGNSVAALRGCARSQPGRVYPTPEGRLVFDINDFDETIRGPFEWDLKRMAASLILAGRESGQKASAVQQAVLLCFERYCALMRHLCQYAVPGGGAIPGASAGRRCARARSVFESGARYALATCATAVDGAGWREDSEKFGRGKSQRL